ncbi:enoyl-CoA hydratase/isomerase family protein [Rossellomorea aquimaris]|uniref:enoyl-CoA hydratase/isomerase family protein n=1 Tax=Rossellomorea aquimaris TaxID=189382 RepID=UPI001CD3D553|nr:enoyl-CoA hydratase/isomerase family protein [Rossellomorea aquimaris]MCA1053404.1 enoyl-CoA hydratase/isomerase family protein [Rossellomorea aquimaris]
MEEYIVHNDQHGVLHFIINRPEKRNAINYNIMDGLEKILTECETNPAIKAMTITGNGDHAFCSGGDLSTFHGLKTADESYAMLRRMGDLLLRLAFLKKPTFAFINGTAIGGGCEIAAACDFRIGKKGVNMGFVQANLAITTGWGGGTLLHQRISSPKAMDLLMTARMNDTVTLFQMGFLNELLEEFEGIHDSHLLKDISSKGNGVLRAYKNQMLRRWDRTKLEEEIEEEIRRCSILWAQDEHHEAVERFLSK